MTTDIETIRLFQTLFVLYIGLYAGAVTVNNIMDYGTNYTFIRNVMGMHTVFPDCRVKWRAIHSSSIYHAVYWVIIASEFATTLLCVWGAWELRQARGASIEVFQVAKTTAFRGLGLGFTLWFAVFMIGAGQWWAAWQSKEFSGQDAAFRIYMAIGVVFVIVLYRV